EGAATTLVASHLPRHRREAPRPLPGFAVHFGGHRNAVARVAFERRLGNETNGVVLQSVRAGGLLWTRKPVLCFLASDVLQGRLGVLNGSTPEECRGDGEAGLLAIAVRRNGIGALRKQPHGEAERHVGLIGTGVEHRILLLCGSTLLFDATLRVHKDVPEL